MSSLPSFQVEQTGGIQLQYQLPAKVSGKGALFFKFRHTQGERGKTKLTFYVASTSLLGINRGTLTC